MEQERYMIETDRNWYITADRIRFHDTCVCVCVCVFDMLLTCLSSHLASCLVPIFKLILPTVLYLFFPFFACLLLGPKLWRFCLNNDRVLNCLSACCVLYCYSVVLIWCSCIWQQDILKHWVLCNEAVPVSWSHLPPAPILFTGFRVSPLCHRWWKYPGCWQGSRGIPSSWRIFGYSNLLWFLLMPMDFYDWTRWAKSKGQHGATSRNWTCNSRVRRLSRSAKAWNTTFQPDSGSCPLCPSSLHRQGLAA